MGFFADSTATPDGLSQLFARSGVSLTLADYTREDCPLVAANQAFCNLSGYAAEEFIGRNWRFLQPEGGAGPVRKRIRDFIGDSTVADGRFVIPNEKKDGTPFLNLVYMSKLKFKGEVSLILGSQFEIKNVAMSSADLYDRALKADLRKLNQLTNENNWGVFGSFDALASSHSILAQLRLE